MEGCNSKLGQHVYCLHLGEVDSFGRSPETFIAYGTIIGIKHSISEERKDNNSGEVIKKDRYEYVVLTTKGYKEYLSEDEIFNSLDGVQSRLLGALNEQVRRIQQRIELLSRYSASIEK